MQEIVEVESGKNNDRPKLKEALAACQRTGSTLLIAKLDRLSRNVAFIANLIDSGVKFVAVDMPQATEFTIHILSAVAQHERKMISRRTKEALQAAKARGVKLGSPQNLTEKARRKGRAMGVEALKKGSIEFATKRYSEIRAWRDQGLSLRAIAAKLNQENTLTARGKVGSWTPQAVKNVMVRVHGR
jgi:DNA invertase Pin-like site-specific DNA recombinase